ncbi:hypothetical protein [Segatella oulorum]|uniref:hypothetical protein n=1 Tax=Segatella oulorum TaxID=28136 RepID=UPI0028EFAC09|nr:hypothetical protein [Segatella oulorum]
MNSFQAHPKRHEQEKQSGTIPRPFGQISNKTACDETIACRLVIMKKQVLRPLRIICS